MSAKSKKPAVVITTVTVLAGELAGFISANGRETTVNVVQH
jgi:hypothetical protein